MHRSPEIPRRDIRFELDERDLRAWHRDGLHVAHFFNALSVFFPEGERFFIDSVRRFRERIRDRRLAAQVEGFIGQEAMHSREHRRYNEALAAAGLPVEALEKRLVRLLALLRRELPAAARLRVTIALEHFTAIMAHVALSDERALAGADPVVAEIWRWHAIEETEHKAVAFDVYREVFGSDLQAYLARCASMLLTTVIFWALVFRYHFRLVRADGAASDVRGWLTLLRFLWLRPGILRQLALPWLAYFRPSFHPWQHDNHAYVERWRARYESGQAFPAPS